MQESQSSLKQQLLQHKQPSDAETPAQKKAKDKYYSKDRQIGSSNIFSILFFSWMTPLVQYGYACFLEKQAIPKLPQSLDSRKYFEKFSENSQNVEKSSVEGLTLVKMIIKTFRKDFLTVTLVVFINVLLTLYSPIMTDMIMSYIEQNSQDKETKNGILLFLMVLVITFFRTLTLSHFYYQFGLLGFNMSNTLSLALYQKALRYPILCNKIFGVSDIINFSQTDAQRLNYVSYQMTALLLVPLQLVIAIVLMYSFIGISFMSGMGTIIISSIIVFILQKISLSSYQKVLTKRDARVKLTEEIFSIIRFIKINAIQKFFFKKINKERFQQLKEAKRANGYYVLTIFGGWMAPPLIISATFITYIYLGNQISAHEAFTTIMIFRILQWPLRLLPTSIVQCIQVYVSLKRVQKFLYTSDIDKSFIKKIRNQQEDKERDWAIKIEHGTFEWGLDIKKDDQKADNQKKQSKEQKYQNKIGELIQQENLHKQSLLSQNSTQENISQSTEDQPKFIKALDNINVEIKKGKLTMILGDIGSGKSSLLFSILNQMKPSQNASVIVDGSIAYVAQKAWIMSTTLKENITFTKDYEESRFNDAVHYSALQDDVKVMADGFKTQIGQKGVNLSGGQKARISLARALYSNRDIYLLDDILSAVDVHVGRFLMKETILKYLKSKTIILATHAIAFAQFADEIIIMEKGKIVKQGTFEQVNNSQMYEELQKLQKQRSKQKSSEDKKQSKNTEQLKLIQQAKQQIQSQKKVQKIQEKSSQDKKQQKFDSGTDKIVTQLMLPEDRKRGAVQGKVYKKYIQMNGGILFLIGVGGSMTLWLVLSTLSNLEMENWCEDPQSSISHLYIYVGLACSAAIFMLIRAYILVLSAIRVGNIAHKKMIKSLLYASIPNFYNRVPIGRVLNRLTKDLTQIDEEIGYWLGGLMVDLFSLTGNVFICLYASSIWVAIPVLIVGLISIKFKSYYMKSQRQVVRMDKITTSPIVGGFSSVINGLATVRAYNLQNQFVSEQINRVNLNKKVRYSREALYSWFNLRLSFITYCINMTAIGYCIMSSNQNPSLAGLLLTYALTLNEDITDFIFSLAGVETKMVGFQRVCSFMEIQPEPGYKQYCKVWRTKQEGYNKEAITQGTIQFKNYSVRYRENLPNVLKSINIKIKSGQKVGIVGRTGAGKSTITSCLLRILDSSEGQLLIDNQNIEKIKLKDLRSCITMIEQQPTLIDGTIKQNLDPLHLYSTQQILKTINQCNLQDLVNSRGGVDEIISNNSLSVGQKQLMCICRAFLKRSKIVLIDEATANIDVKNDELIQKVIKQKFKSSTVLTIAHRLSTLVNSDKILVLGQGRVLQWGSPEQLARKQGGIYREMCQKNNQQYLK